MMDNAPGKYRCRFCDGSLDKAERWIESGAGRMAPAHAGLEGCILSLARRITPTRNPEESDELKREPGYYWVELQESAESKIAGWLVAEYFADAWWLTRMAGRIAESRIARVGPMIAQHVPTPPARSMEKEREHGK